MPLRLQMAYSPHCCELSYKPTYRAVVQKQLHWAYLHMRLAGSSRMRWVYPVYATSQLPSCCVGSGRTCIALCQRYGQETLSARSLVWHIHTHVQK